MRETLKKAIREGNISYFKHDFMQVNCSAEGHAHLPTRRHGFEANLDAILALMDYERQLKPDILRAPTSYVWLSPWWLMHANYVYWGANDTGAVSTWPQLSPSEWEMNYHDGHLYKVLNKWRHQVSVSALVTQAFARHPQRDTSAEESLREWADYAMMVCGRGLRLMDLYLEPEVPDEDWTKSPGFYEDPSLALTATVSVQMPPQFWQALGESIRWWQENVKVLGSTRMIGGNPRNGEVYGYVHWKDNRGIICLRNPHIAEQVIRIPFDKSMFYRGQADKPFRGRVIYPYVENLPDQFMSGKPILLGVPGYTVMLVELQPGQAPQVTPVEVASEIEGKGSVAPEERDWTKSPGFYDDPSLALTATVSVQVPDEEMNRCDLFLLVRSNGELPEFTAITLNGQPAKVRTVSGAGDMPTQWPRRAQRLRDTETVNWSVRCMDLKEFHGKNVEMIAVSSKNPVPFMVDVWVVADRPVEAPPHPQGSLPPLFWHNFRRQTVRLLSYCISHTPVHH